MRVQYFPDSTTDSSPAPVLVFSDTDLFLDDPSSAAADSHSPLLDILASGWTARQHLLRYPLSGVRRRLVCPRLGLFADYNPDRFAARRVHADVESTEAPFNPAGFHFGKADPAEITLHLWHESWGPEPEARVPLYVNVAPIDLHHYVIVPDIAQGLNQRLTQFALTTSLQLLLMTPGTRYRVGFNSLMAFASVNHLHCHLWLSEPVTLATEAPLEELLPELGVHSLPSSWMPVRALVFELDAAGLRQDFGEFVRRLFAAVAACQRLGMPHNLMAGKTCCGGDGGCRLRVCLFPRLPARFDSTLAYCVAVAELSGQLIVQDPQVFDSLDAEAVMKGYARCALPEDRFQQLLTVYRELVGL